MSPPPPSSSSPSLTSPAVDSNSAALASIANKDSLASQEDIALIDNKTTTNKKDEESDTDKPIRPINLNPDDDKVSPLLKANDDDDIDDDDDGDDDGDDDDDDDGDISVVTTIVNTDNDNTPMLDDSVTDKDTDTKTSSTSTSTSTSPSTSIPTLFDWPSSSTLPTFLPPPIISDHRPSQGNTSSSSQDPSSSSYLSQTDYDEPFPNNQSDFPQSSKFSSTTRDPLTNNTLYSSTTSHLDEDGNPRELPPTLFPVNEDCTSLTVTPCGRFIVSGFSDGTVRVFDLIGRSLVKDVAKKGNGKKSNARRSTRVDDVKSVGGSNIHGGHVLSQIHAKGLHTNLIMSVAISEDSRFAFAGVLRGSVEMVCLDLSLLGKYYDDKKAKDEEDEAERFMVEKMKVLDPNYVHASSTSSKASKKKSKSTLHIPSSVRLFKHQDAKLKGFGAVTRLNNGQPNNVSSYLLFCGKGIKNIHIWLFSPPCPGVNAGMARWECIYDTQSNGMTVKMLGFRRGPNGLQGVSKSDGQCVRLWDLSKEEESAEEKVMIREELENNKNNNKNAVVVKKGNPKRPPFTDVPNTEDSLGVFGLYAFGGSYSLSIVEIDLNSPFNKTEVALPKPPTDDGVSVSSNERRRGMRIIQGIIGVKDGGHVLLELSDGSFLYYSNNTSSSNGSTNLINLEKNYLSLNRGTYLSSQVNLFRVGSKGQPICLKAWFDGQANSGGIDVKLLESAVSADEPNTALPPSPDRDSSGENAVNWGFSGGVPFKRLDKKARSGGSSNDGTSNSSEFDSELSCSDSETGSPDKNVVSKVEERVLESTPETPVVVVAVEKQKRSASPKDGGLKGEVSSSSLASSSSSSSNTSLSSSTSLSSLLSLKAGLGLPPLHNRQDSLSSTPGQTSFGRSQSMGGVDANTMVTPSSSQQSNSGTQKVVKRTSSLGSTGSSSSGKRVKTSTSSSSSSTPGGSANLSSAFVTPAAKRGRDASGLVSTSTSSSTSSSSASASISGSSSLTSNRKPPPHATLSPRNQPSTVSLSSNHRSRDDLKESAVLENPPTSAIDAIPAEQQLTTTFVPVAPSQSMIEEAINLEIAAALKEFRTQPQLVLNYAPESSAVVVPKALPTGVSSFLEQRRNGVKFATDDVAGGGLVSERFPMTLAAPAPVSGGADQTPLLSKRHEAERMNMLKHFRGAHERVHCQFWEVVDRTKLSRVMASAGGMSVTGGISCTSGACALRKRVNGKGCTASGGPNLGLSGSGGGDKKSISAGGGTVRQSTEELTSLQDVVEVRTFKNAHVDEIVTEFSEMVGTMVGVQKMEADSLAVSQSKENGARVEAVEVGFPFPEMFAEGRRAMMSS